MKSSLTATGFALAVILSSASAYDETLYAHGVPDEQQGDCTCIAYLPEQ